MDLKRLHLANNKGIPLYNLPYGQVYKYTDYRTDGNSYTFAKHVEHVFPQQFKMIKKNCVTYQYKVGIPESLSHQVIFVDEVSLVEPIDVW